MKWTNKGHEFDGVYEILKTKKKFYLFGVGMYGKAVYEELKKMGETVIGFIDNDSCKQHTKYDGLTIYPLEEVQVKEDEAIVLCISAHDRRKLFQQLFAAGYKYNENLYTMEIFMSLKFVYGLDKMYVPAAAILPSSCCNLNCKACLNFTPYIKKHRVLNFESVKADIDEFFSVVDYTMLFMVTGGEPFIYPDLERILEYVGENYRHKMHFFQTITNGTIDISDDMMQLLAKYDIRVTLDDYRDALPETRETYRKVTEGFRKYGIEYDENKVDYWIDLAPTTTDHSDWDEERLQKYFQGCNIPWQDFQHGRLYACSYACYAQVPGFAEEREDEAFYFKDYTPEKKKELMEFRLGYNAKGYTEFCKRCAGFMAINDNVVTPAIQVKRNDNA